MSEKSQNNSEQEKETNEFLYPIGKYYGEFTPGKLAFNSNLQIFAQRVSYLCALEAGGKISPETTYLEIKKFWEELEKSQENLIENDPFS